jgi:hypothetical protein
MNTVNVGPFNVLKDLPPNTHLMAAWGAVWTFGHKVQVGNKYVKPLPVLRDNKFFISRDPFQDIAAPGTEVALVIQVRTVEKAQRTSQKTFPTVHHHAVANTEGRAWMIPSNDYWKTARFTYSKTNSDAVSIAGLPSFNLPDLVGEAEFKKMVAELKTIVRKL